MEASGVKIRHCPSCDREIVYTYRGYSAAVIANRPCKNCWQKANRKQRGYDRKYERGTKGGFLMRVYRNMKSRVLGVQKREREIYFGLEILPKDQFYAWSMSDNGFHVLFENWVASGRKRNLAPSIDRVDDFGGYVHGNMEWITQGENSSKATRRRHARANSDG